MTRASPHAAAEFPRSGFFPPSHLFIYLFTCKFYGRKKSLKKRVNNACCNVLEEQLKMCMPTTVPLQSCLRARFVRRNPFVCAPTYYIPLAQKRAPLLPSFTHKSQRPHLCANRHMSGCAPFPCRLPEYTVRPRACSCTGLMLALPVMGPALIPTSIHVRPRVSFGTMLPSSIPHRHS